ncbi:tRNA adenosine(34) deaminase TadA [bacterium]|nr:tRNA adenosine(34) deaminase TadA [bacterium]
MKESKEYFMKIALEEAEKARKKGEVPVGAVLVQEDNIISRGHNQPVNQNDPTSHAEINAIRKGCQKKKNYRLPGCDLYVTLEPCAMCLGAVVLARIRRLIFGAYDPKSGAVESVMKFPFERMNHQAEIQGGVMVKTCSKIVKEFFKDKR